MAVNNTLYILNTYTIDTLTDIVPAAPNFTMASFYIVNTAVTAATVTVNITDAAGTILAPVVDEINIDASQSKILDLKSLNIPATSYKLMAEVNVAGVYFIASGITIT